MTLRPPHDPEQFRVKVGRWGERFYIDRLPADGTWEPMDTPVPSVTTVKKAWPKFFSKLAADTVAACAYDERATWQRMDRAAAVEWLAAADKRRLKKASNRGSGVHAVIEGHVEGNPPLFVDPDVEPYLEAIEQFLADIGPVEPVAVETVAIKRGDMGYGGTLDAIWHVPSLGGTWLLDWKSRKPGKFGDAYEDDAAQLVAYATADYLIGEAEGVAVRQPVPELDGMAIVAIAPDGYRIHPVKEG